MLRASLAALGATKSRSFWEADQIQNPHVGQQSIEMPARPDPNPATVGADASDNWVHPPKRVIQSRVVIAVKARQRDGIELDQ